MSGINSFNSGKDGLSLDGQARLHEAQKQYELSLEGKIAEAKRELGEKTTELARERLELFAADAIDTGKKFGDYETGGIIAEDISDLLLKDVSFEEFDRMKIADLFDMAIARFDLDKTYLGQDPDEESQEGRAAYAECERGFFDKMHNLQNPKEKYEVQGEVHLQKGRAKAEEFVSFLCEKTSKKDIANRKLETLFNQAVIKYQLKNDYFENYDKGMESECYFARFKLGFGLWIKEFQEGLKVEKREVLFDERAQQLTPEELAEQIEKEFSNEQKEPPKTSKRNKKKNKAPVAVLVPAKVAAVIVPAKVKETADTNIKPPSKSMEEIQLETAALEAKKKSEKTENYLKKQVEQFTQLLSKVEKGEVSLDVLIVSLVEKEGKVLRAQNYLAELKDQSKRKQGEDSLHTAKQIYLMCKDLYQRIQRAEEFEGGGASAREEVLPILASEQNRLGLSFKSLTVPVLNVLVQLGVDKDDQRVFSIDQMYTLKICLLYLIDIGLYRKFSLDDLDQKKRILEIGLPDSEKVSASLYKDLYNGMLDAYTLLNEQGFRINY